MTLRSLRWLALAATLACVNPLLAHAAGHAKDEPKPCLAPSEAVQQSNRDVCVAAHVYEVVQLSDGTRFLDLCPAEVSDADCRFIIVSEPADREAVGDLRKFRGQNVQIRGIVRSMHGRMGILLSHARQFSGGPEKFRPNRKLLSGFNGQSDRMPVHDPNLLPAGPHRSFMNSSDKESLPIKRLP
jgi:hypothetical protein